MRLIRRPSQVTDAKAIIRAIKECDQLGREKFREKYGYGKAVSYFLRHEGKTYDSKAIVGVAYGYQYGVKPLRSDEFSGGIARVVPVLTRLGFAVTDKDIADEQPVYCSEWLAIGEVYTRDELRGLFGIKDATINNGVFKPSGSQSIWLFVTKNKTSDRPQLVDLLNGDTLHWEGQPAGKTDDMLIEHLAHGDEVLLFYRDKRDQYPGGGFRFEGSFLYGSHKGSKPTSFIFTRDKKPSGKAVQSGSEDDGNSYDPKNTAEGRARTLREVTRRQGQPKFRKALLAAYDSKCAITGCAVTEILEAAHIRPYDGKSTNHVTNGLLLRADLHTLFDLGLISVRDDYTIRVCASLSDTEYAKLRSVRLPAPATKHPSKKALAWHRDHIARDRSGASPPKAGRQDGQKKRK